MIEALAVIVAGLSAGGTVIVVAGLRFARWAQECGTSRTRKRELLERRRRDLLKMLADPQSSADRQMVFDALSQVDVALFQLEESGTRVPVEP